MTSTAEFLRLFFNDDEEICFRTFPPKGVQGHPKKEHGSIHALENGSGLLQKLISFNRDSGVYFVVNFGGDADKDIHRFNAAFCESDTATIEAQHKQLDECPLPTTARVETARSVHAYWKLCGDVARGAWREAQLRLITFFDGDPAIRNESRVMRVPGFFHIDKNGTTRTPVKVVQYAPDRKYTIEELLAAFPPVAKKEEARSRAKTASGSFTTWDALRAELGRRIMEHESARQNAAGNWDCRGICHDGESQTGLFYSPATNQVHCLSGCEQAAILQAFGLPEEPEPTTDDPARTTQYSDDALADDFSARHADDLCFVPQWGWLSWTGQRWQRISDVAVMDLARLVCRSAAKACRENASLRPATRQGLARTIASAKTVAAVERLARGDKRHLSEVWQWDADLWLFNTPGGTVDLRTGELRPHRREDRITKISNVTPSGVCPLWIAFLRQITNEDADLQAYLQRLAGYSLVGDPSEECLDFFHGRGGNGKGTFLDALLYTFGEYATTAAAETFMEARGEKHPCDVAKLAGARLVVSQEIDENQRWDEARVKAMTGRDTLSARFMRQDFFDFKPQFTLIIAGNHKPALKTVDASIRRRFHLVPFIVEIPLEHQDQEMKNKLRAEGGGILAWAIQGCLEWQRIKLSPPKVVLDATNDYLEAEDTFEQWLSEVCIRGSEHEERTAFLYESFRRWKQNRGEQPPGLKTFTTRLTERGFSRDRDMHGWKMIGLRLDSREKKIAEDAINERRIRHNEVF